jgi:hypothetical protein
MLALTDSQLNEFRKHASDLEAMAVRSASWDANHAIFSTNRTSLLKSTTTPQSAAVMIWRTKLESLASIANPAAMYCDILFGQQLALLVFEGG